MNNERVTLAQELHDGIAQDLVVLGFSIDQAISDCNDPDLKKLPSPDSFYNHRID